MTPSPSPAPLPVSPEDLAAAVRALRDTTPLVQCLTNIVVANFTANALLSAGAAPAMVDNPHESAEFAAIASGVLVNLGTPYDDTAAAMARAAASAQQAHTPWVLDPIGAGALSWRTPLARTLLAEHQPTIVRGNASEILGLAGGAGGRGADSTASSDDALAVATQLAAQTGAVIAVSGVVDVITAGPEAVVRVANGDPLLTRVTGAGCALGALMAGYAAVASPLVAAVAATAHLTVAADVAAAECAGPGSFAVALIDALANLTPEQIAARVRLA